LRGALVLALLVACGTAQDALDPVRRALATGRERLAAERFLTAAGAKSDGPERMQLLDHGAELLREVGAGSVLLERWRALDAGRDPAMLYARARFETGFRLLEDAREDLEQAIRLDPGGAGALHWELALVAARDMDAERVAREAGAAGRPEPFSARILADRDGARLRQFLGLLAGLAVVGVGVWLVCRRA
jgi:hypothetical protein